MKRLWLGIGFLLLGGALVLALAWPRESSSSRASTTARAEPARHGTLAHRSPGDDVVQDDDVRGTLRLEGQVLDTDTPVAGVTVAIDTRPPRTAITEADGSFAFDGLLGREYELVATSGEQVAGPVTVELTERTEPVVFRLRRGAEARVTVVTARDRAPAQAARVELRGVVARESITDATGTATFRGVPPGWYRITASSSGHARATTIAAIDQGTSAYRFELVPGVAASGRVVDSNDRPVAGAKVRYEAVSDFSNAGSETITTGSDGAFRIDGLAPGSFRFTARHELYAPGASDAVVLSTTSREGITIRLAPGAVLAGSVVDKDDRPVPWAKVRVAEETAGIQMQRARQTTADAEGNFELRGLSRTRTHAVAFDDHAASTIATIDLGARERAEMKLVLDLDDTIAGTIVDSTGEPLDGARVVAEPDQPGAPIEARLRGRQQAIADADGRFALRGLAPGRYQLRTSPPGALEHGRSTLRETIAASSGDRAVRIVVPADGAITGRVAFPDGRTPATFVVSLGGWGNTVPVSTRDGSFTIPDVPPRTYQLAVRGPGFAERTLPGVVVAAGKTADAGTITVRPGRSISGRVIDADGKPVAGASVLAGPMLWGTGSKTRTPSGIGGPPGSDAIQDATTDERGMFTLTGVGRGPRHLIADHDALGRSLPLTVPPDRSASDIELVLVPLGTLQGKVTSGGKPAARVIVNAQSKTVPEAMFSVVSGADGVYRFDRLTPDRYSVSAMVGMDPMRGMSFHARTVTVSPGGAATADLAIDEGAITLEVTPSAEGRTVSFAIVESVEGTVTARTYDELKRLQVGRDGGLSTFGMAIAGNPARIRGLRPATYTVCAVPYPDEVGALEGMEYLMREGDNLPVYCKPVAVAPTPKEQALAIDVKIPAYVPPAE
jgi:protocatechuate 3,4-dioxygenase beta subunit